MSLLEEPLLCPYWKSLCCVLIRSSNLCCVLIRRAFVVSLLEEPLLCRYLGESVPEDERTLVKDASEALSAASSVAHLPLAHLNVSSGTAVTDAERVSWEEEKQKLYQQLDDKV